MWSGLIRAMTPWDTKQLPIILSAMVVFCVVQVVLVSKYQHTIIEWNYDYARRVYNEKLHVAIKNIGLMESGIDCNKLTRENGSALYRERTKRWKYNFNISNPLLKLRNRTGRCNYLTNQYGFNTLPLSDEEKEFPIAYGLLIFKNAIQIYHMMSAIYHPQNAYCIAISNGSDAEFKRSVNFIGECFPNVHVMIVRDVRWGEYGVLTGVLDCLRFLAASKIKWKYYQYLSGFDLPLKTNGEMVRIFKRLNGSFNSEVTHFENYRIAKKKSAKPPQGVRLFKSSLSATFSRESANFMVNNKKVKELIDYLNGTFIPDETFWTTVAGNPEKYPMPGGFNGTRFLRFVEELERRQQKEYSMKYTTDSSQYYISRYQVWWGVLNMICAGKFVAGSCVYGVGDIPILLRRYELVAHKFYLDYQPAAYFCVYQKVRQRAVSQHIDSFDDRPYANLPGPAMARGVNLDVWMRRYFNPKPVTRAP